MNESNSTVPSVSAQRDERAQSQLIKDNFPLNAQILFYKTMEIGSEVLGCSDLYQYLVKQMIHSILFLGNIHPAKYKPEEIFERKETHDQTKEKFPEPFKYYQTHVPLQTPFSYFLKVVLMRYGPNNEDAVKRKLSDILMAFKKKSPLNPAVLCICESGRFRHYGVSLSCGSDVAKKIMTAVSCLHVWHPKVASVVMSVFIDDTRDPARLQLPSGVTCRAYTLNNLYEVKPPCLTCNQLFSLLEHTKSTNLPGNCAETEAISNYFNAINSVFNGNDMPIRFSSRLKNKKNIKEKKIIEYFDDIMKKLMESRSVKNRDQYSINQFFY